MYHFKTNCVKERLTEIRCFVAKHLQNMGLPETVTHKITLAVDEVCTNMIIHSNQCNAKKFLEVYITHDKNKRVTFEITDYGTGFNHTHYKAPELQEIIQKKKKGGLGLRLVNHIMDTVEFKKEKGKNTYIITKNLVS